jgi:ubiquinone/menaquinone biosynthesis C-methylase UbiE
MSESGKVAGTGASLLAYKNHAPGHGRWTEHIVNNCRSLTLIDLSPSCIEYCGNRFHDWQNVSYFTTDGRSLPNVSDVSVHFIWSFDSFVHMGPDIILAYLQEAARVLRPHGLLIIHHAGRRNSTLSLGCVA